MYNPQAKNVRFLTEKEICALIDKWKKGDDRAIEALVRAFEPLILKRTALCIRLRPHLREEFLQAGRMAIVEAASTYSLRKGVKFASCAICHLRTQISEVETYLGFPLRGPRSTNGRKAVRGRRAAERKILAETPALNGPELEAAVARELDVPVVTVRTAAVFGAQFISADARDSETGCSLLETLADDAETPEAAVCRKQEMRVLQAIIQKVLADERPRNREIVREYYSGKATLAEIGVKRGFSRSRAQQIIRRFTQRCCESLTALDMAVPSAI